MKTRFKIIQNKSELLELVKACKEVGIASVDFETNGQRIYNKSFMPTVLAVTFQPGQGCIIPLGHKDSPFKDNWLSYLLKFGREVIENPAITKMGWNWKFDNQIFAKYGILVRGTVIDGMLAKYLLNEERPNGLKEMVDRYLPEHGSYEEKDGFNKIPWGDKPFLPLCEYSATDTDMTFRLCTFFEKRLIDLNLYTLYRNLIMPASIVLQSVESRGLAFDAQLNKDYQIKYRKLIDEAYKSLLEIPKIKRYTIKRRKEVIANYIDDIEVEIADLQRSGKPNAARLIKGREDKLVRLQSGDFITKKERELLEPINFNSTKQLIELLYLNENGLKYPILQYTKDKNKQTTSTPSTAEDTMLNLLEYDKYGFVNKLLELRGLEHTNSAFIEGYVDLIQDDTRIHPKFNIHTTVTGRLSSSDPNAQQIPKKEVNADIKQQFITPPGHLFLAYDYSQAELRIMAHLSGDETLLEAFRLGRDPHLSIACKKYGEDYDKALPIYLDETHPEYKVWKVRRKQAKCFTGDTEVLTPSGWVRLDEYSGDQVAAYDMQTGAINFENPLTYFRKRSNKVYTYEDRNISISATNDHNLLFIPKNQYKPGCIDGLEKKELNLLQGERGYMVSAGEFNNKPLLTDLDTRLLVMMFSDGCYKQPGVFRLGFSKTHKIQRCHKLLTEYGIKYTYKTKDLYSSKLGKVRPVTSFYIKDFQLYTKLVRYCSKGKHLSKYCLTELSGKVFMDELQYWDSHTITRNQFTHVVYSNKHESNIHLIQALGSISGIRTVTNYNKVSREVPTLSYRLGEDSNQLSRVDLKFKHKPGSHWVYCLQVPSQNLMVRHNHKVSVQGNCIVFGCIYGIEAKKLALQLSDVKSGITVTKEEAQKFLDEFFGDSPKVKRFMKRQQKKMEKNGFVSTLFGRKRRCPNIYSDNYGQYLEAVRASFNAPCLLPSSQALSKTKGWVNYQDLEVGDLILAFDPHTGLTQWEPCLEVNAYQYKGNMVRLKTRHTDIQSTPDHRWYAMKGSAVSLYERYYKQGQHLKLGTEYQGLKDLIHTRVANGENLLTISKDLGIGYVKARRIYHWESKGFSTNKPISGLHVLTSHELLESNSTYSIPIRANHQRVSGSIHHDNLVAFLGWYLTDGSLRNDKTIKIYQSRKANLNNVVVIDGIMQSLEIDYTSKEVGDMVIWSIKDASFVSMVNSIVPDRKLNMGLLSTLNNGQLSVLLENMRLGDGYKSLTVSDKVQASLVQALVVLCGKASHMALKSKEGDIAYFKDRLPSKTGQLYIRSTKDSWGIKISNHRDTIHTKNTYKNHNNLTEVPYEGVVWCPTVPSGAFMVRYETSDKTYRTMVTGNCQSAASDMALFASILIYWEMKKGNLPPVPEVSTVHDSIYNYALPELINPWTIYQYYLICKNPDTKKYFKFSIDDVDMAMDFTVGRTMIEELPYTPGYDYKKLLAPDFNLQEYYDIHAKTKAIPISDYPTAFPQYFTKEFLKGFKDTWTDIYNNTNSIG